MSLPKLFLSRLFLPVLCCFLTGTGLAAQWTGSVRLDDGDMALDLNEALSFQKYPTYEQYVAMMQHYASAYPGICRLDTFGRSQEGRLLLALKISDQVEVDEPEAAFMYSSTMHGDEVLGYVLLLRLADTLLSGYGTDSEINALVDQLAIWINPLANPDGSFSNDGNLSLTHAIRRTVDGTDLNRNFPDPKAGEADDTTGRALENRQMMEFLREHRFSLSANLHGGAEVVNYPWDFTPWLHADDDWYRFVSREYADEAKAVDPGYMGLFENGITNGWAWYEALGTRQDYVNYYLEGREVTLELSLEKMPVSDTLEHFWRVNYRSLLNYMSQCLYGIRGVVTDLDSGDPLRAQIYMENHDSTYSVVHSSASHGDFYRLIKEGVYDLVVSAPGYLSDTILSVAVTDYQATRVDIRLKARGVSVPEREAPGFRIYPNPASQSFRLEAVNLPQRDFTLSIHRMDGRLVYFNTLIYSGSVIDIPTDQLESGIYLVRCTSGDLTEVQRLLVIHADGL